MMHMKRTLLWCALDSALVLTLAATTAHADVSLDSPFRDHAVLQRDRTIRVTGRAEPNEALTLTFGSARIEGNADANGHFALELAAMPASLESRDLVVAAKSGRAAARDVLVGEVWFCSGQSNMEWNVDGAHDADRARELAPKLAIRSYKAPHATANRPAQEIGGVWRVASAETVGGFTAVGWWFAVELARSFDLGIPIGLVDISWGGTRIEPWIPLDELAKSDFKATADELAARIKAFESGSASSPTSAAKAPGTDVREPAAIYNAMMAPCIAYPVRGTIWYQGESNAGEPDAYRKLLPLLMNSWRAKSGNPDMAWGVVQLAGFMPFVENEPAQGAWALLREAQYRGAIAGKGGMISATDLGDAADIHPRRKREVGERLAAWARNTVYGEQHVAWRGPELASATLENGGKVRLRFDHAQGLRASGDAPGAPALGGFALAGADGRFVWADAMIMDDGRDGVMLSAPGVTDPVEVVYAWQNNPTRANLVNGASLPAVPFRVKVAR
jgi:sialate O-acetylesterase